MSGPLIVDLALPSALESRIPELEVTLLNVANLIGADLRLRFVAEASELRLAHQGRECRLRPPDLTAWSTAGEMSSACWREVAFVEPAASSARCPGEDLGPDLLGLMYYLFRDLAEIHQEAATAQVRYDIHASPFRDICATNYLDRLLQQVRSDLGIQTPPPKGVLLTHDLDFLSVEPVSDPLGSARALARSVAGLRLRMAVHHGRQLTYALWRSILAPTSVFERFEFLDWAEAERQRGFRSVLFVFAPDRRRSFPQDASYDFGFRNRRAPISTLRSELRGLMRDGFWIGLHLSRSSDYEHAEMRRELRSLSDALGSPIRATRNHWLWMRYSDWYERLAELDVDYDFNAAAIGFTKGTAFPYFNRTGRTVTFPTTYMDDIVLKTKNLGLDEVGAIALLKGQLDAIDETGGCLALSFHPGEDGPPGTHRIPGTKLDLYGKVLDELSRRGLKAYLPDEAKREFLSHRIVRN